jgi:hypothetical protein
MQELRPGRERKDATGIDNGNTHELLEEGKRERERQEDSELLQKCSPELTTGRGRKEGQKEGQLDFLI